MADQGVRLQLLLGPTLPVPAPGEVMNALVSIEVTNNDRERDGFQMTFDLDRSNQEYTLLQSGLLEPQNRVLILVLMGARSYVLMDGIITRHQVVPGEQPGRSTLQITGEDISIKLDLEEKNATYPNQTDSAIVRSILSSYATYGLQPKIEETREATPRRSAFLASRALIWLIYSCWRRETALSSSLSPQLRDSTWPTGGPSLGRASPSPHSP